jgi:hypothetical protein
MHDAYITLWNQPQVEYERRRGLGAGIRLDHSANRQFRRSGVKRGDRVYVVATRAGALSLLARIEVERVVGQREAERHFGNEFYRAPDHVIGRGTELDLERVVPEHVARAIRRESGKPIKIAADSYHVDAGSLRTTGRISEDSAALLDALLGPGPVRIDMVDGHTFTEGSRREQRRRVIER